MNDWVVELSKSTEDRIMRLGGRIVPETAEDVDEATLDSEGRYTAVTHRVPMR